MDIVMIASEMLPYAKTGGLADVVGALPLALSDLGEKVSVIIPCYRGVEKKFKPKPTGVEVSVPILEGEDLIEKKGEVLMTTLDKRVDVYLVKMDEYYDRKALYMLPEGDYKDNCARFTFFCRAALQLFERKNWRPDVIHCHDWQSALVPIYLNTVLNDHPALSGVPVVFTIHNLGYQGLFWSLDMKLIGVPWEYFNPQQLEYYGKLNLLKGGIVFSDAVTTVSKGYAREIQTPEYGLGLEGVIASRADVLHGIVNGIDYRVWDPAVDKELPTHYSAKALAGKSACKAALQKELKLPVRAEVPLIASISRLADQKGFDLISAVMDELMELDVQFALLGTGDKKYHEIFEELGHKHPDRAGIRIAYDEGLAHRIEAGADMFLMPSHYEPCGLNQLISMKYGTAPVVRATGGLDDTVTDWDDKTGRGTGFKFHERSTEALLDCIKRALSAYSDKDAWGRLIKNCMKEDHSWSASAKEYLRLYSELAQGRERGG